MAESLRRLVNIGSFSILQEKLEKWLDGYKLNTCDQNVARGCEIIELNAKVQGQLFKLLNVTSSEGGMYGGANIIKSRLLPWLGQNFFTAGGSVTADTSLSVLADAAAKNHEIRDLQDMYERSLQDLEEDLKLTRAENDDLRDELEDTREDLSRTMRCSTSDKMLSEAEIKELQAKLAETKGELTRSVRASSSDKMFGEVETRELRRKLALAEDEIKALHCKAGLLADYEDQIQHLREDIALLTGRKGVLLKSPLKPKSERLNGLAEAQDEIVKLRAQVGLINDYERQIQNLKDEVFLSSVKSTPPKRDYSIYSSVNGDLSDSMSNYRYLPRAGSPLSPDDPVQRVRQHNLISRFNDMFAQDRLDAMDTLRRVSNDHENNQRIMFTAMQEAFSVAKLAFRQFKMKVRANLAATHIGPETLEEAVQDYVNRNTDLYDLPGMVSDVIRALNRSPKIFLPPETSYAVIQPFIREACKLSWQMSALAHPLDISAAADAELFDDYKYRRSYDSEYTAPLMNHHIWPCLVMSNKVLMKGEAMTKRGASLGSPRRSRSPTRSFSPTRSYSPSRRSPSPMRGRSRSPSPRRSGSPFRR